MDLVRDAEPDSQMAKMRTATREWYSCGALRVREAEQLFDTFLKELELSGYTVKRGRHPLVDMTVELAKVQLTDPRLLRSRFVGIGSRLHYYVVWGVFLLPPRKYFGRTEGVFEETFEDPQDAMDWVADYIRSWEEHGKAK